MIDDRILFSYSAKPDIEAYHAINKHLARREWKAYRDWYVSYGAWGFCLGSFFFFAGSIPFDNIPAVGILISGVSGLGISAFCLACGSYTDTRSQVRRMRKQELACYIGETYYALVNVEGTGGFYPWEAMKIEIEIDAAWLIRLKDSGSFIIFREPLRQAGLEEEVRRRISA